MTQVLVIGGTGLLGRELVLEARGVAKPLIRHRCPVSSDGPSAQALSPSERPGTAASPGQSGWAGHMQAAPATDVAKPGVLAAGAAGRRGREEAAR